MSKNVKNTCEFDGVLNRLMQLYHVTKHADLCRKLNLSPQTLSTWRSRNKIPFDLCVLVALETEVSLDWLILGKNTPPQAPTYLSQDNCSFHAAEASRMHELEARIKKIESRVRRKKSS